MLDHQIVFRKWALVPAPRSNLHSVATNLQQQALLHACLIDSKLTSKSQDVIVVKLQFQLLIAIALVCLIASRLRHTSPDTVGMGIYLPNWADSITLFPFAFNGCMSTRVWLHLPEEPCLIIFLGLNHSSRGAFIFLNQVCTFNAWVVHVRRCTVLFVLRSHLQYRRL